MIEIHELLGRDLDPIDEVRRQFERSYNGNYFHPLNGDWISDDYYRIIDLTTRPEELAPDEVEGLNRAIIRLNDKYSHIEKLLGESSLLAAYNDVASQINAINSTNVTNHIALMQPTQVNPAN